jgi:hypothetical protein
VEELDGAVCVSRGGKDRALVAFQQAKSPLFGPYEINHN